MLGKKLLAVFVVSAIAASTTIAQEKIDNDIEWKIRREATEHSQILNTLHMLTDVLRAAPDRVAERRRPREWVVQRTTEWGLKNAHLEPWEFGHPGWLNERTVRIHHDPVKDSLVVEALAWTPGTNGTVTAPVIQLESPARVTKEQLTAFFDGEPRESERQDRHGRRAHQGGR